MTETNTQPAIETHAVEVDSSRDELLTKYGVTLNTLKKWCSLIGIDYRNKITFTPDEVAKLDFAHHKLQVEKLTYSDFEQLVSPDIPKPGKEQGYHSPEFNSEKDTNGLGTAIKQRYGSSLDAISDQIVEGFWTELDNLVVRKLAASAGEKSKEYSLLQSNVANQLKPAKENQSRLLLPEEGLGC